MVHIMSSGNRCGFSTVNNLSTIIPTDIDISCNNPIMNMSVEEVIITELQLEVNEFNLVMDFIRSFFSNVSVNIFQDQSNDARRPVIKLLICSISLHLKSETIRKLETTTVKLSDEEIAEFRMNKLKEILQFTENML